mmetsp:Transcript_33101/g.92720  ORF Transcript_33101/g.92720 Transcript_33101/m.92720 type:complete len:172 (-) Transcript_33101:104-619(-)|eukprot:CAMPEP_0119130868 /NCGR_PEP_ID=MMETSP1310-20130426/9009_1 /TAXON_ID=464262 /ORGANISM="Genus nov. species nov., Strain RCC2339" /LENGTH=171 /DNA_ID=CAMNT_0007121407 /DNA_START=32 /DNA_END=547 /DNA_ORIENTATION=+
MATMAPKTVKDVAPDVFVKAYAAHLKNQDKFQLPTWVDLIKTAKHKELAPYDPDWMYTRAAAIARKVYCTQGLGVGQLRKVFGGAYRKGHHKEHFSHSAGGHLRYILQQLEKMGILEKYEGAKGGRKITPAGQRDLDLIAQRCAVEVPAIFLSANAEAAEEEEDEEEEEEL